MAIAQRRFADLRSAAVAVQAQWRARATRARFVALRAAAVTAQSERRRMLARRGFLAMRRAALAIQSGFRRVQAQRRFLALRAAATAVQARARMAIAQRRFADLRSAAVAVQAQWRARATRARFVALRAAAVTAQARARGAMAERAYTRARAGAVLAQAHWRGSRTRRSMTDPRFADLRARMASSRSTARAHPERTVGSRCEAAIAAFGATRAPTTLASAVAHLELAARYSDACALRIAERAGSHLCRTVAACDRSAGHTPTLRSALAALAELASSPTAATRLLQKGSAGPALLTTVLVDAMQMHRDRGAVLPLALEALEAVCEESADAVRAGAAEPLRRLAALRALLARAAVGARRFGTANGGEHEAKMPPEQLRACADRIQSLLSSTLM